MIERRYTQRAAATVETRESEPAKITGVAAVFYNSADAGTEYPIYDDIVERIMPGAFDRAIKEAHDVRALFNHDSSAVLGRLSAGTLRLNVTAQGLAYEIDAPDTTHGRDAVVSLERGDVTGSSFAFIPRTVTWREADGVYIREVNDVDLVDVGPVTYPAYDSATAGVRSAGDFADVRAECNEYVNSRQSAAESLQIRERILQLNA